MGACLQSKLFGWKGLGAFQRFKEKIGTSEKVQGIAAPGTRLRPAESQRVGSDAGSPSEQIAGLMEGSLALYSSVCSYRELQNDIFH